MGLNSVVKEDLVDSVGLAAVLAANMGGGGGGYSGGRRRKF